jgi:hypothetical protein
MQDNITIAEVGSIVNVSGSRIATPLGPPRPGDEDAEHQAEHHQQQCFPGQQHGKTVHQEAQGFHYRASIRSIPPAT